MKRLTLAVLFLVLASVTVSASAQVNPTANERGLVINVGGEASLVQPDYAGNGVAQKSPNWLYGPGAYVDARFTRWIQVEAEGHWLKYNEFGGIGENSYSIGARVPVSENHRLIPYGKALLGWGSGAGWLSGRATVLTLGGGVDYRLWRRLTLRPIDFEYQAWNTSPRIGPTGFSAGISYRILGGRRR